MAETPTLRHGLVLSGLAAGVVSTGFIVSSLHLNPLRIEIVANDTNFWTFFSTLIGALVGGGIAFLTQRAFNDRQAIEQHKVAIANLVMALVLIRGDFQQLHNLLHQKPRKHFEDLEPWAQIYRLSYKPTPLGSPQPDCGAVLPLRSRKLMTSSMAVIANHGYLSSIVESYNQIREEHDAHLKSTAYIKDDVLHYKGAPDGHTLALRSNLNQIIKHLRVQSKYYLDLTDHAVEMLFKLSKVHFGENEFIRLPPETDPANKLDLSTSWPDEPQMTASRPAD